MGEGGKQGAIGGVTVEHEGTLVVEEVRVAFMMTSTLLDPLAGFVGSKIVGAVLILMAAAAPAGSSLNLLPAYLEHRSTFILNWTVIVEEFP